MYGLSQAHFEILRDKFIPLIEELLNKAEVKREGPVEFTMELVETDKGNINHSNVYRFELRVRRETMVPIRKGGYWGFVKQIQPCTVLYFYLSTMPGCCGVLISNSMYVYEDFRNKGLATLMQQFKEQFAFSAGYTVLLATEKEGSGNRGILQKSGWEIKSSFNNRRSANQVNILVKELKPIGPK